MKLTKIRDNQGNILSKENLEFIGNRLVFLLSEAGFITESFVINSSRIDLKTEKKSFKIDVEKLGYNARLSPFGNYKAGYRRTSTPTWNQRVEYNNIINEHLDLLQLSCNIKSAHYVIRQGNETFDELDWENQKKDWEWQNESRGFKVVSIDEV